VPVATVPMDTETDHWRRIFLPSQSISATFQFKRGTSEDDIAKTLAEGISIVHTIPALHHTHHELLMPQFNHLTKTQRRSIALYVISLRSENSQRSVQP